MNPNQQNGLPPLPQTSESTNNSRLMQPVTQSMEPAESVVVETVETKKEWSSTPWMLGIFVLLVLIAILTIVAMSVYNKPAQNNSTSSSSRTSTIQSASSSENTYGLSISKYEYAAANGEWSYEITGYLPTPCHVAKSDVVIMESFPEQAIVSITFTAPPADTMCIQMLKELTITGKFKASEKATLQLGTVKIN